MLLLLFPGVQEMLNTLSMPSDAVIFIGWAGGSAWEEISTSRNGV
jgi:hypothetical protein